MGPGGWGEGKFELGWGGVCSVFRGEGGGGEIFFAVSFFNDFPMSTTGLDQGNLAKIKQACGTTLFISCQIQIISQYHGHFCLPPSHLVSFSLPPATQGVTPSVNRVFIS